jgi:hypothetical protein
VICEEVEMSRKRFVIRTIRAGSVKIHGRVFRPNERDGCQPYTGQLDGQKWAFGLYWGPPSWDQYDANGLASFVSLWGDEAFYRDENAPWPGQNCINGRFQWEWWDTQL